MESRRHCAAARLRSGSPTRLRSAAQRRNHTHPPQVVIPNTLTNPFQDLTDGDFLLLLENKDRRAVPLAPGGKLRLGGGTWATTLVAIEAGKARERSYRLDALFDLKEAGDYSLRVFRQKPPETYPIAVQPVPNNMKLIESEPVMFKLTLP